MAIPTGLKADQIGTSHDHAADDSSAKRNPYYNSFSNLLLVCQWVGKWIGAGQPAMLITTDLWGKKPETIRLWFYGAKAGALNPSLVARLTDFFDDQSELERILVVLQTELNAGIVKSKHAVRISKSEVDNLWESSVVDSTPEPGNPANSIVSTIDPLAQFDNWLNNDPTGKFELTDIVLTDAQLEAFNRRRMELAGVVTLVITRKMAKAVITK